MQNSLPIKGFPSVSLNKLVDALHARGIATYGVVGKALDYVEGAYVRQKRASGNDVLDEHIRPVTLDYVDYMWEGMQHDVSSASRLGTEADRSPEGVASALLHDVLEDIIGVSRDWLAEEFGENVFYRVDKVTNSDLYGMTDYERRHAVNQQIVGKLAALELGNARDWSVFVLKMCDVKNALQTIPLPGDPLKEARVVSKVFNGRLALALGNSAHFYNAMTAELERAGYRDKLSEFELQTQDEMLQVMM